MFFVLFLSVLCFNMLDCKKSNLINVSLTKKEADFIVKAANASIQTENKEHGVDYEDESGKGAFHVFLYYSFFRSDRISSV